MVARSGLWAKGATGMLRRSMRRALITCFVAFFASSALAVPPPPVEKQQQPVRKGWFGIGLEAASDAQQKTLGITRKVPRVTRIFRGSPAETAGVAIGDFVLAFQGTDVATVKDLVQRVGAQAPGAQVDVKIHRPGEGVKTLKVVLDLRIDQRERFKKEWLGRPMPSVSLKGARETDGESINLSPVKNRGDILVIDYFATWCGPCKAVMPRLEKMAEEFADQRVRFIGVSGEEVKIVTDFLAQKPLAYKVGIDTTGDFNKEMLVTVLPTIWIVDRAGVIREIFFGAGHTDALHAAIKRLAAEPTAAP